MNIASKMNIAINMGMNPIFIIMKEDKVLSVDQRGLFWREKKHLLSWRGAVTGKTSRKVRDHAIQQAHKGGCSIEEFMAGAVLCKVMPRDSDTRFVRTISADWIDQKRIERVAQRVTHYAGGISPR
jgi:hypothetical protein